jgi:hypothetical protein
VEADGRPGFMQGVVSAEVAASGGLKRRQHEEEDPIMKFYLVRMDRPLLPGGGGMGGGTWGEGRVGWEFSN